MVYFGILLAIQFVLKSAFVYLNYGLWGYPTSFYSKELAFYIVGVIGVAFWLRISKLLASDGRVTILPTMGRHSMDIMYFHLLAGWIIKSVFAVIHLKTQMFADFEMQSYLSDFYYAYYPRLEFFVLYLIGSIALVLAIGCGIRKVKNG